MSRIFPRFPWNLSEWHQVIWCVALPSPPHPWASSVESIRRDIIPQTSERVRHQRHAPSSPISSWLDYIREVPNGVGADGVGVKFPIFPVNCSRWPLFQENRQKNEEKRRKAKKKEKKNEEKRKKKRKSEEKQKKRKKWENSSDPIYTNPIKNLPIHHHQEMIMKGSVATTTRMTQDHHSHHSKIEQEENTKGHWQRSRNLKTIATDINTFAILQRFLGNPRNIPVSSHSLLEFPDRGWIVPSQQGKIHAHSFVLRPKLWIQYTYTYVKNSEHHQFELDTYSSRFSQEFLL